MGFFISITILGRFFNKKLLPKHTLSEYQSNRQAVTQHQFSQFLRWKNKFNPRNTACMPVVKFIFRLELEKICIM